jgi:signal peptidase I
LKTKRQLFDYQRLPRRDRTQILACMLFWSILSYGAISRFVLQAGEVVGQSMHPTLHAGDRFLMCRATYLLRESRRGDIIALRLPHEPDLSVKRVIALAGDHVSIRDSGVYVNGERLEEPYLPRGVATDPGPLEGRTFVVAPACLFVLGDNRAVSVDSRYFGAIQRGWVVGTVRPGAGSAAQA